MKDPARKNDLPGIFLPIKEKCIDLSIRVDFFFILSDNKQVFQQGSLQHFQILT